MMHKHDVLSRWLAHRGAIALHAALLAACVSPPVTAQTCFSLKTNDYGSAAAVAFSPDSRLLALAADGADVVLFDVAEQREVVVFKHAAGAKAPVSLGHLAFSPDSQTLAVGFCGDPRDRQIVFFDIVKRAARGSIALDEDMPAYFAFSADGSRLAARVFAARRAQSSEVRVWDSHDLRLVKSLDKSPYASDGTTIAFSADGKWLATAHGLSDAKGQVMLWDAATLERRFTLRAGAGRLELAFSRDSRLIAAGINHRWNASKVIPGVRIWDVQTGKERGWMDGFEEVGQYQADASPLFAPQGAFVAATCHSRDLAEVRLWNRTTGEARVLDHDRNGALGHCQSEAKFSPDGALLATAANFGQFGEFGVRLWETKNWTRAALLDMSSGIPAIAPLPATPRLQWVVGFIAFSPDGKWLAARRTRLGHESKQDVFLWKVSDVVRPAPNTTEN